MRVILVFVDGLGLGDRNPRTNPCASPGIRLLACFENSSGPVPAERGGFLVPTDAVLGVDGLPQSATGQTTILSGINCAKLLGRHLQGYPNERLREVLKERSILKQVKDTGRSSAFINAYRPLFFRLKEKTKWRLSTTTVANLAAENPFFRLEDIGERRSIYHDYTNERLIQRGFDVPRFSAEDAAEILSRASKEVDFILYEYFLTDRAGHSQMMDDAIQEIRKLEDFLDALLLRIDLEETLIILTSDHGNIEDLSVKSHTRNRAMTLLWGCQAENLKDRIHTLEDIAPAILRTMKQRQN
jgi:2,3-bisphosphoglycerate-independent phosphoglycerate mutase